MSIRLLICFASEEGMRLGLIGACAWAGEAVIAFDSALLIEREDRGTGEAVGMRRRVAGVVHIDGLVPQQHSAVDRFCTPIDDGNERPDLASFGACAGGSPSRTGELSQLLRSR